MLFCLSPGPPQQAPPSNAIFDDSGNFLAYPTLFGIKVVNLVTNRVSRLIGKVENTERFVRVTMFQSSAARTKLSKLTATDGKAAEQDPTIVACAYRKQR